MDNTPQNNNMLEEVNKDLAQESSTIGHSLLIPGILIGVVVLLLGGIGWYVATLWLFPAAPVPQAITVTNQNTNHTPVQITSNTVETEGAGKTQLVDEETRIKLAQEASATLKESQAIASTETTKVFTGELASHMEELRKIRNYLFINVQTLLQGNSNKEKLLSDYMNTLIAEKKTAADHVAQLQTTIGLLQTDYTSYQADQKRFQDAYKQAVSNYDPQGTADNLEKFITSQSMASESYTRLKAMQTMVSIYTQVLAAMNTKMEFIAANKEALLKEVQVVNVKSLEEKLILSEKEWLQSLNQ